MDYIAISLAADAATAKYGCAKNADKTVVFGMTARHYDL